MAYLLRRVRRPVLVNRPEPMFSLLVSTHRIGRDRFYAIDIAWEFESIQCEVTTFRWHPDARCTECSRLCFFGGVWWWSRSFNIAWQTLMTSLLPMQTQTPTTRCIHLQGVHQALGGAQDPMADMLYYAAVNLIGLLISTLMSVSVVVISRIWSTICDANTLCITRWNLE